MPGLTNRGAHRLFRKSLATLTNAWLDKDGAAATLATFYAALIRDTSAAPTADTNTLSELTQPSGNGYTDGGVAVPVSTVGWPTHTEDDTSDKSIHILQDLSFSATPGNIGPIRFIALTDDAATVANRQVLAVWQLASDVTISGGTTVIFEQGKIELRNTSW